MTTPESDQRARAIIEWHVDRLPVAMSGDPSIYIKTNPPSTYVTVSVTPGRLYRVDKQTDGSRETRTMERESITQLIAGLPNILAVTIFVDAGELFYLFNIRQENRPNIYRLAKWNSYSQYLLPGPAPPRPVPKAAVPHQPPLEVRNPLDEFVNRRTQNVPTYRVQSYIDPTTFEPVTNLKKALFIQENVRNGVIYDLYNPQSLYDWFRVQGKTTSPTSRRQVTKPFLRLPNYLTRNVAHVGTQTSRATHNAGIQTNTNTPTQNAAQQNQRHRVIDEASESSQRSRPSFASFDSVLEHLKRSTGLTGDASGGIQGARRRTSESSGYRQSYSPANFDRVLEHLKQSTGISGASSGPSEGARHRMNFGDNTSRSQRNYSPVNSGRVLEHLDRSTGISGALSGPAVDSSRRYF